MALQAPFKKCTRCGNKLPTSDGHNLCLFCLGEGHKVEACAACQAFSRQTRKHRADKLRAELWNKALKAVETPTMATPTTSTARGSEQAPIPISPTRSGMEEQTAPLTPGRARAASLAKKLSKKARQPNPAESKKRKRNRSEQLAGEKKKRPQRISLQNTPPSTSTIPPQPSAPGSTPRIDTVAQPPTSTSGLQTIARPSTSEREIRDSPPPQQQSVGPPSIRGSPRTPPHQPREHTQQRQTHSPPESVRSTASRYRHREEHYHPYHSESLPILQDMNGTGNPNNTCL